MSRIGKNPVQIPEGVQVAIANNILTASGKLGKQEVALPEGVTVKHADNVVTIESVSKAKVHRQLWGTIQRRVANAVSGVAEGFTIRLEVSGVGYRAQMQGKDLKLQLGYSHDIMFPVPEGVTVKCEKPTLIVISGADKQLIGQVAAEIKSFRRTEPYKGKGVKFEGAEILRKEGKKK